ncbi:MAG: methyltransferase [Gammaproteobacteria bacterium]
MTNNASFPDPSAIMSLATAYWNSQIFLTAHRIGLFALLAKTAKTSDQIATALNTKGRPTALLLNACVALGLLEKDSESYKNAPSTEFFLVPGSPAFMGNAISYSDDLYETWGKLEQCLREDKPMLPPAEYLGSDVEKTRHFVYGMHNRAMGTASALVNLVDLGGRRQLLDVGGGPGTYSCMFAGCYPELKSKVLDLPGVVAHANDIINSMGKQHQVSTLPGDYHTTEFPGGNEVVLISGVFHRESEEDCRKLIDKAADSLNNDGMLIISDVFADMGCCSPLFATLFGMNMALTAEHGCVHADADVMKWMADAGFVGLETKNFPPPMPHRLIAGYKR